MLGEIERMDGDYARSAELIAAAVADFRREGNAFFLAAALPLLALSLSLRNDFARSRALCSEGIEIARRVGNDGGLAVGLQVVAIIEVKGQEYERAASLFGAADALRASTGMAVWEGIRKESDRARAIARARLGTTAFERGYSSGGSEPVADILDVILERLGSPSS